MMNREIELECLKVQPLSQLLERFIDGTPEEQSRAMVVTGLIEYPSGKNFNHILMLNILQPDNSWCFFLMGMNTIIHSENMLIHRLSQLNRKMVVLAFDKNYHRFYLRDDDFDTLEDFKQYQNSNWGH